MQKIKDILTHGLSKKVIYAIIVLAAVDMFSMAAPYYLKYVIPHVYTYLNVSQADYDQMNAVLGYVVLAFQIPSGILADRMSGKKLLIISVVMSGILTVMFGLGAQGVYPGASSTAIMYVVFVGFGISTTLFLWSPLWKVLSDQGKAKDQSSLYGLQGSYNGLLGLLFITLIGTIATSYADKGNNSVFYALVYIVAAALFVSAFGIWYFVKESNYKSAVLISAKKILAKIKSLTWKSFTPYNILRVWLLSVFVLGMYMFQSVFAYYLKSYLSLVITGIAVTAIAGFRTYGLRLVVSGPFGAWMKRRKSWVLTMAVILAIGMLVLVLMLLLGGVGNKVNTFSDTYRTALKVLFPILFLLIGTVSWFLVAGRYMIIDEVPHTKYDYGTTIALISFIAFSSDAWFYQMASSWMKSSGHVMTAADVKSLGYGAKGGYDQAGLQMILFVGLSIVGVGVLSGLAVYLINRREIIKLGKTDYRWRKAGIDA